MPLLSRLPFATFLPTFNSQPNFQSELQTCPPDSKKSKKKQSSSKTANAPTTQHIPSSPPPKLPLNINYLDDETVLLRHIPQYSALLEKNPNYLLCIHWPTLCTTHIDLTFTLEPLAVHASAIPHIKQLFTHDASAASLAPEKVREFIFNILPSDSSQLPFSNSTPTAALDNQTLKNHIIHKLNDTQRMLYAEQLRLLLNICLFHIIENYSGLHVHFHHGHSNTSHTKKWSNYFQKRSKHCLIFQEISYWHTFMLTLKETPLESCNDIAYKPYSSQLKSIPIPLYTTKDLFGFDQNLEFIPPLKAHHFHAMFSHLYAIFLLHIGAHKQDIDILKYCIVPSITYLTSSPNEQEGGKLKLELSYMGHTHLFRLLSKLQSLTSSSWISIYKLLIHGLESRFDLLHSMRSRSDLLTELRQSDAGQLSALHSSSQALLQASLGIQMVRLLYYTSPPFMWEIFGHLPSLLVELPMEPVSTNKIVAFDKMLEIQSPINSNIFSHLCTKIMIETRSRAIRINAPSNPVLPNKILKRPITVIAATLSIPFNSAQPPSQSAKPKLTFSDVSVTSQTSRQRKENPSSYLPIAPKQHIAPTPKQLVTHNLSAIIKMIALKNSTSTTSSNQSSMKDSTPTDHEQTSAHNINGADSNKQPSHHHSTATTLNEASPSFHQNKVYHSLHPHDIPAISTPSSEAPLALSYKNFTDEFVNNGKTSTLDDYDEETTFNTPFPHTSKACFSQTLLQRYGNNALLRDAWLTPPAIPTTNWSQQANLFTTHTDLSPELKRPKIG